MIKVETRRRMKEDRKDRERISGNKETKQGSMNERKDDKRERKKWVGEISNCDIYTKRSLFLLTERVSVNLLNQHFYFSGG